MHAMIKEETLEMENVELKAIIEDLRAQLAAKSSEQPGTSKAAEEQAPAFTPPYIEFSSLLEIFVDEDVTTEPWNEPIPQVGLIHEEKESFDPDFTQPTSLS